MMVDTAAADSEKTFDITIANGAAKKLQVLMDRFNGDELKVVSLALEILSLLQNADVVQFKNKGDNSFKGFKVPNTITAENK